MKLPPAALSISVLLHACVVALALRWAVLPQSKGTRGDATEIAVGFALVGDDQDVAPLAEATPQMPEAAEVTPPTVSPQIPLPEIPTNLETELPPVAQLIATKAEKAPPMPRQAVRGPQAREQVDHSGGRARGGKGNGGGAGVGGGGGAGSFVPPRYRNCPAPVFPAAAKRDGRGGVVILTVAVDRSGVPTSVTVHRSSGSRVLDDAATAAVRRWRFEPARAGGEAVAATVEVPIRFRL